MEENHSDNQGSEPVRKSRSRSRSRSPRRSGRRFRSRSPRGRIAVSSDTQRNESHLKRGRIFVGNIDPTTCRREDLKDTFSRYGDVLAVSIHNGYAFVQLDSEKSANSAINLEHGRTFNGKKINVEFSSAAIKAGAKFRRLSFRSSRSPPSHRHHHHHLDPDPADMAYLEHERRVARIMALENELQNEVRHYQRSREYDYYPKRGGSGLSDYPPPSSALGPSRQSMERPRDYDRDVRPKPPMDYYDIQRPPPQSPPRGTTGTSYGSLDYPERDMGSLYNRGSGGSAGYSREWETPSTYSSSYTGGAGKPPSGPPPGSW